MQLQKLKGMQSSKQGLWKGCYLSIEGTRKEYLFRERCYKGYGVGPRDGASPFKHLLNTPPTHPGGHETQCFNIRLGCLLNSPLACLGFTCTNFAKKNKRLHARSLTSDETRAPRRELNILRAGAAEYFRRTSRCFIWWWNTVSNAWYHFSNKMI